MRSRFSRAFRARTRRFRKSIMQHFATDAVSDAFFARRAVSRLLRAFSCGHFSFRYAYFLLISSRHAISRYDFLRLLRSALRA